MFSPCVTSAGTSSWRLWQACSWHVQLCYHSVGGGHRQDTILRSLSNASWIQGELDVDTECFWNVCVSIQRSNYYIYRSLQLDACVVVLQQFSFCISSQDLCLIVLWDIVYPYMLIEYKHGMFILIDITVQYVTLFFSLPLPTDC